MRGFSGAPRNPRPFSFYLSGNEETSATRQGVRKMETIKEHFSAVDGKWDLAEFLDLISYGQYPDMAGHKLWDYQNWEHLLTCCLQAINELAAVQFNGPESCAMIMDIGMKRLKKNYHVFAPSPWVPVMRQLRAMRSTRHTSSG